MKNTMNNPIKSQIAANRERFEKLLNKVFPKGLEVHTPDGDSRSMRQRMNDLYDEQETSLLQTAIAAVEGLKTEEREGLNLPMDRSLAADKGYELALSKVVELLKGGIDN